MIYSIYHFLPQYNNNIYYIYVNMLFLIYFPKNVLYTSLQNLRLTPNIRPKVRISVVNLPSAFFAPSRLCGINLKEFSLPDSFTRPRKRVLHRQRPMPDTDRTPAGHRRAIALTAKSMDYTTQGGPNGLPGSLRTLRGRATGLPPFFRSVPCLAGYTTCIKNSGVL